MHTAGASTSRIGGSAAPRSAAAAAAGDGAADRRDAFAASPPAAEALSTLALGRAASDAGAGAGAWFTRGALDALDALAALAAAAQPFALPAGPAGGGVGPRPFEETRPVMPMSVPYMLAGGWERSRSAAAAAEVVPKTLAAPERARPESFGNLIATGDVELVELRCP